MAQTQVLWVAVDHEGNPLGDAGRIIAGSSRSRVCKTVATLFGLESFSEAKRKGWAEVKKFVLETSQ